MKFGATSTPIKQLVTEIEETLQSSDGVLYQSSITEKEAAVVAFVIPIMKRAHEMR